MPLNVIISGAGIAGLTAAISLRRCGHRVTLYERSAMNNEVGAAITVPPNVSRFLLPWGFDTARARFRAAPGMYLMSHKTMEPIVVVQDHKKNTETYGAPFFFTHRVDLHEELRRLATDPEGPGTPAEIHLKAEVTRYNPEVPSMTLADGTVITGDVIIAADGVHSVGVEAVIGHPNPPMPARHDNCCYRFFVPKAEIEADPVTKPFLEGFHAEGARLFIDPEDRSRRLVTYLIRDNQIANFVVVCTDKRVDPGKKEDWHASVDKSDVLNVLHGFDPLLLAVVKKTKEANRWPLLFRAPIPTWHKGKFVLIGDAAHPMLPHHAQGGAMAKEDGFALGLVLNGVTDPSQIEERLALFDKLRHSRVSAIQVLSNYGFEEKIDENVTQYMEGQPVPRSPADMIEFAYSPDILEATTKMMQEFDPSWKVPEGFFPGAVYSETHGVTDKE